MNGIICGPSAFKYHRTPPQVLALCPTIPASEDLGTLSRLPKHPTVQAVLGSKIHLLVNHGNERTGAKHIKQHLWTGELPSRATLESPVVGTVASPLLTLFTLARTCTTVDLAMAMHELCGEFTVYRPSDEMEQLLERVGNPIGLGTSWRRAPASEGRRSSLWMRPPLIEIPELMEFAREIKGRRDSRRFAEAASMVQGVTRSPLEVRAAMLMGLPRVRGGRGMSLKTNHTIPLTSNARRLARRNYCVADIYLESPDGSRIVDIECQGDGAHSGPALAASDANRTVALESMGVGVIPLSHEQIRDERAFELVVAFISQRLDARPAPRSERMRTTEKALRRDLFQSWETLCDVS